RQNGSLSRRNIRQPFAAVCDPLRRASFHRSACRLRRKPQGTFAVRPIQKSKKLADVCYDIRGPVLEKARQMEEDGHKIIKLNIGNLATFGFDAPDEIVQDMIRNMANASGYTDSKGLFAPRK